MWFIPNTVIGGAFCTVILTVFIRALLFKPEKKTMQSASPLAFNSVLASNHLAELIRCKTVSSHDKTIEDNREFERLEELLPSLFPYVFEKCDFEKVTDRALLFRWKGKSPDEPTVLMAHYDVVYAEDTGWDHPPFDGDFSNGYLWGRGTLDTKATFSAILESANILISEGFIPEHDVYFAFVGDEEINGGGARAIVELFKSRGITPSLVLDEGGAVVQNVFPGVKGKVAVVGIAEKGFANIEYSVVGGGGHASTPKKNSPLERLSRACLAILSHQSKFTLSEPARRMLDTLGRHSSFLYRIIFANLWCFSPILSIYSRICGGELNAIFRTTTAFTVSEGSSANNVIPASARMVSNHRIVPGDTVDELYDRVKRVSSKYGVDTRLLEGIDPSDVSFVDSASFELLSLTISEVFSDTVVSPYLMLACSDARAYSGFSSNVYRFSPIELSAEERATIHGTNERISREQIQKTVEFYLRLNKKL